MDGNTVKADVIAGITVALVLIPQSMAYAQLAEFRSSRRANTTEEGGEIKDAL